MKKLVTAAAALALAGCVVRVPPPRGERIVEGRPGGYRPGVPESYWTWHDAGGWHVRVTTAGLPHRFHGWVEPAGGVITDLRPTRIEWNDRIRMAPRGVEFDFQAAGGDDGFDFHVSSGCARFFLYMDGVGRPGRTFVGAAERHPRRIPFERCR